MKDFLKHHEKGFGGSDAKMFYKVGLKGISSLSATDKNRIAVAMGLQERKKSHTTPAMQAGNDFEAHIAKLNKQPNNVRIDGTKMHNFKIFAHADFYQNDEVIELKYSQQSTKQVTATYMSQLQWYYMLGAKKVTLMHGLGEVPFNPENYETKSIVILRNEKYIEVLRHGIKLIDEYCNDFTHKEMHTTQLAVWDRELVKAVADKFRLMKQLENEVDDLRAELFRFMDAGGIDTIENDKFKIVRVEGGVITKTDYRKACVDAKLDLSEYKTESERKGYVKVAIKES